VVKRGIAILLLSSEPSQPVQNFSKCVFIVQQIASILNCLKLNLKFCTDNLRPYIRKISVRMLATTIRHPVSLGYGHYVTDIRLGYEH